MGCKPRLQVRHLLPGMTVSVALIPARTTVVREADFVCGARGFNPGRVADDSASCPIEMITKFEFRCARRSLGEEDAM
jgi:hypothetical protein